MGRRAAGPLQRLLARHGDSAPPGDHAGLQSDLDLRTGHVRLARRPADPGLEHVEHPGGGRGRTQGLRRVLPTRSEPGWRLYRRSLDQVRGRLRDRAGTGTPRRRRRATDRERVYLGPELDEHDHSPHEVREGEGQDAQAPDQGDDATALGRARRRRQHDTRLRSDTHGDPRAPRRVRRSRLREHLPLLRPRDRRGDRPESDQGSSPDGGYRQLQRFARGPQGRLLGQRRHDRDQDRRDRLADERLAVRAAERLARDRPVR